MDSTGCAVILSLFCLLHSINIFASSESIHANGSIQAIQKQHQTSLRYLQFLSAWRDQIQYENDNDIAHLAGLFTPTGKYYGLQAKIGVWGHPDIRHSQESGASIHATNMAGTMIEAGFHVRPYLYKNNDVHFYTFWLRSGNTGCFNLNCQGFVPARGAALVPGQAVAPPSTYGGEDRYITISLHTDPRTGDWVLYRDDLEKPSFLGHFPKDLCPDLNGGAPHVVWTGFVIYPKIERGPQMGSGHFPEEGEKKSAYFKNMKLFDSNAYAHDPIPSDLSHMMTRPDCYKISPIYLAVKDRYMFYYGGPGGCIG